MQSTDFYKFRENYIKHLKICSVSRSDISAASVKNVNVGKAATTQTKVSKNNSLSNLRHSLNWLRALDTSRCNRIQYWSVVQVRSLNREHSPPSQAPQFRWIDRARAVRYFINTFLIRNVFKIMSWTSFYRPDLHMNWSGVDIDWFRVWNQYFCSI